MKRRAKRIGRQKSSAVRKAFLTGLTIAIASAIHSQAEDASPAERAIPAVRAGTEPPPEPTPPPVQHRRGAMVVAVNYGPDGRVHDCRVLRSNAPLSLESSTLNHIRAHWGGPFFASSSEIVPLIFDESTTLEWNGDMALPPNFFPDDSHQHDITLRITFDQDGWVASSKVLLSSGIQLVDEEIAAWVKVHWHSDSYANKTVDAPFVFQQTKEQKPTVSMLKPKNSDQAAEPLPIPAMRAQ